MFVTNTYSLFLLKSGKNLNVLVPDRSLPLHVSPTSTCVYLSTYSSMFDSSVVQTSITEIFKGQQPQGWHTRLQKQVMQKGRHPSFCLFFFFFFCEDDSINISTPVTAAILSPYSSTFSP
ncbi:hypothetical protein POVWA2_061240 [Plasmodium ovale wallikeri]|uniref:Uncharacterized protein n=1 Tax=Plasmodium ovale wallikeri TaxID=864142 RepID=A0A1A9A497_PLAOA|nr:hypothetical protein POVWA2_061240 [Plasmodium ovale wallikeri]